MTAHDMTPGLSGRRFAVIAFAVVAALAILVGLGTWQMQRHAWKGDLLSRIDASIEAEPVAVDLLFEAPGVVRDDAAFTRVAATGRFDHARELYLFGGAPGEPPGYRVVTPLIRDGAPPVLVIRGSVPEARRDPATRPEGQVRGEVTVTGLARVPDEPRWFTPRNAVEANLWFSLDPQAMAQAAGVPDALPLLIEADATPVAGGVPRGRDAAYLRDTIPNRHVEYALTWYGLAVVLIVMCFVFAWRARRQVGPGREAR